VDVVGAVLDVVVFDVQPRPLDTVVVGLAGLGPAGPAEVDRLEPLAQDPFGLECGQGTGQPPEVLAQQPGQ
jgi:hypothetical protein